LTNQTFEIEGELINLCYGIYPVYSRFQRPVFGGPDFTEGKSDT